jgi:AcrR family transcriptional regulator
MTSDRLFDITTAQRRQLAAQSIERSAIELFMVEPVETVTVSRIAGAAGVSVRNFYRYFAGKDDIMAALPLRRAESIAAATLGRPAAERPFQAMRAAIDELSGTDDVDLRQWQRAVTLGQSPDRMAHLVVAVTSPILARTLAHRTGGSAGDLWPDIAGVTVATALVAGARRWAVHGGSLRRHILQAIDVVGIGLDHGPSSGPQ